MTTRTRKSAGRIAFVGSGPGDAGLLTVRLDTRPEHVDSGPDANLDQTLDFQCDQRLAYRRTGHPELLREVALGRKARARDELARADQLPDLVRDLPIQPAWFDTLEWHGDGRRLRARASSLAG